MNAFMSVSCHKSIKKYIIIILIIIKINIVKYLNDIVQ